MHQEFVTHALQTNFLVKKNFFLVILRLFDFVYVFFFYVMSVSLLNETLLGLGGFFGELIFLDEAGETVLLDKGFSITSFHL